MYDNESDSGPQGTFEIYKAEADTLLKQGDYRKAIESYTIVSTGPTRIFEFGGNCLIDTDYRSSAVISVGVFIIKR